MAQSPKTIWEIEREINNLTGKHPGQTIPSSTDTIINLLRNWLLIQNVPEHKALNMSRKGLINAFAAGNKWVRENLSGGEAIDLDEVDLVNAIKNKPTTTPFQPTTKSKPTPVLPSSPPHVPYEPPKVEPQIDLGRVYDYIDNSVERAGVALRDYVHKAIKEAEDTLSDKKRNEIVELAVKVAAAAVETFMNDRVPNKLEIRLPNKPPKILDAAPRHKKFDQILRYLTRKRHIYIVGNAGTGKTKLGEQLAEALDKKFYPIAQALTKYDVSGYKSPTGEYIGTLLREAIEFGGLALIDEGDTWAAAALTFLNAPLANGYCAFPDKVVKVHPDFLCIIAANTYGHGADRKYQGRNPLDAASLNRFAFVEVDYDRTLETHLFGNGPWTQYCWRVRDAVDKLQIPHVISMRNIEFCNEAASCGDDPDEIASAGLWQGLPPDTIARIKSTTGEPPTVKVIDLPRKEA